MSDSNTPRNSDDATSEIEALEQDPVLAIGQAATELSIDLPAVGTSQAITAQAGQRLQLNFDATQAAAVVDGQNLVLNFDLDNDGTPESSIVFENLAGDFADEKRSCGGCGGFCGASAEHFGIGGGAGVGCTGRCAASAVGAVVQTGGDGCVFRIVGGGEIHADERVAGCSGD